MKVKRIVNSVFNSNTFIVYEAGKAIVFDIGDVKPLTLFLEAEGLDVEALFITHTHYDHIYGIKEFMKLFPSVPIFTSSFGKEAFHKSNWNFSRYHEDRIEIESDLIRAVSDGDRLSVLGEKTLTVMETPGHDKSCLTFKMGDFLFTGDSYIPGVKVIASFPNSNKEDARRWYEELKEISKDFNVYPGHGEAKFGRSLALTLKE